MFLLGLPPTLPSLPANTHPGCALPALYRTIYLDKSNLNKYLNPFFSLFWAHLYFSFCWKASSNSDFKRLYMIKGLLILYIADNLARDQNLGSKFFLFDTLKILFNYFLKSSVTV